MKILYTEDKEWDIDFKKVRDRFLEEYKLGRESGETDYQFVEKTLREMGPDRFASEFGPPSFYDSDVEAYD